MSLKAEKVSRKVAMHGKPKEKFYVFWYVGFPDE